MNELEIANFERGLEIDKDDLDRCLVEQPGAYQKVAEAYAIAVSERDGLKDALKQEEARAFLAAIDDAADKGEKKPTDATIAAMIALDTAVMDIRKLLNKANQVVETADGLREAYRERAYALKELSRLWAGGYWQEASTRGSASREVSDDAAMRRRAAMQQAREARAETRNGAAGSALPRRRIN